MPRPRVRSLDWAREHVQTHEGRPYDHGAYPHLGAPGGPFDALDDPRVQRIWLQWATRLGKSFFGQVAQLTTADNQPSPMMFVSAREKLAIEVVERTYRMLELCGPLKHQVRPAAKRRQDQIELDHCRVYVGWARSPATLADKAVRVAHANEIDKWEHLKTSTEADPLKLLENRCKEYPTRKLILESTPTIKGRSRVERGLLGSTNCRYWVPCPHCGRYQRIQRGSGGPGGLVWDKAPGGQHDADLALRTARYLCLHCEKEICDEHRPEMMRRGVWAPAGCEVDDKAARAAAESPPEWRGWSEAPWIRGTPLRDGTDAGYQLSSYYALSLGWGDCARELVACKGTPSLWRDFINSFEGETWEIAPRQQTWQQLYQRTASDVPHRTVPEGFSMLTAGVDKQRDHYVVTIDAWSPGRNSHTIDYGQRDSLDEVYQTVIDFAFPHADGGAPLRPACTLIDSGFRPKDVYEFARLCQQRGRRVLPAKGSSTPLGVVYRLTVLGANTSMPGMRLVLVDTQHTQEWIERQLHDVARGQAEAHTLFAGTQAEHQDFLEQLLNDAPVSSLDARNYERETWQRIDTDVPNDYRDCRRLGWAGLILTTRNAPIPPRGASVHETPRSRPRLRTPDGRPFLILER